MNGHRKSTFYLTGYCMLMFLLITGCKEDGSTDTGTTKTPSEPVTVPAFNRDSAYTFVEKQVAFGPRNPGSQGIAECREWIVSKFEQYGANVIRQRFQAKLHSGETFPSENLIGQFNPDNRTRILLAAHYDTRAIAEEDSAEARRNEPILGADDGGSGVGVLLEIARLLDEHQINLGVDIIFFDAEDQGTRDNDADPNNTSWCLGAQYWARNIHTSNYKPRFGILLDMVGGTNAFFSKENVTGIYPHADAVHRLYTKVWNLANAMGKGRYFQNRTTGVVTDDHYFVNIIAGIPMIDIINRPPNSETGFDAHWHTHGDDMSYIDKNTLGAVGQVVTAVVYRTAEGSF